MVKNRAKFRPVRPKMLKIRTIKVALGVADQHSLTTSMSMQTFLLKYFLTKSFLVKLSQTESYTRESKREPVYCEEPS